MVNLADFRIQANMNLTTFREKKCEENKAMSAMVQFYIKATKYTAEATTITTENSLYLGLFLRSLVTDRRMRGEEGKLSGRGGEGWHLRMTWDVFYSQYCLWLRHSFFFMFRRWFFFIADFLSCRLVNFTVSYACCHDSWVMIRTKTALSHSVRIVNLEHRQKLMVL